MNKYIEELSLLEEAEYENKVVAFIDIMGMKQLIINSEKPDDLFMYNAIISTWKYSPFPDGFKIISFSDCMYIIADENRITELFGLLAHFSHCMLFNDSTKEMDETNKNCTDIQFHHCHKIRGGITFGKVYTFDTAVFGKAAIKAYGLECNEAVYPRIIVDKSAFDDVHISLESSYVVQDSDGRYFFDFMAFNKHNNNQQIHKDLCFLNKLIEFVNHEIHDAFSTNNAKLIGQLEWYARFLEKYK
ncbi:MAG: hypothetical protein ACLUV3_00250 [Oscillospiraceae bacterium]|jgi:hypothetical protein